MKKRRLPVAQLLAAVATVGILCWLLIAVADIQTGYARQGKEQLTDAIRKAAVACYAAEGAYPPTLGYLQEHYGLQIDEDRYAVFYEIFAQNMMPDITVLEREQ